MTWCLCSFMKDISRIPPFPAGQSVNEISVDLASINQDYRVYSHGCAQQTRPTHAAGTKQRLYIVLHIVKVLAYNFRLCLQQSSAAYQQISACRNVNPLFLEPTISSASHCCSSARCKRSKNCVIATALRCQVRSVSAIVTN